MLCAGCRAPTAQVSQGKWPTKIPFHRKVIDLEFWRKTMDCVCSGCKFPDSQGKKSWIPLPSQFCVCNNDNSRKLTQGKFAVRHGKITWNLKNAICISGCSLTRPACPPRGSPRPSPAGRPGIPRLYSP